MSTDDDAEQSEAALRETIAQLEHAVVSNRRIGIATGILMISSKLTADDAFAVLRQASQHSNRRLIDIAEHLILTGVLLGSPPSAVDSSRE